MRIIWHAFLHLCVFGARCAPERTTLPITISTSGAAEDRGKPGEDEERAKEQKEEEEAEEGQKEIEAVPMTEQVMNPNIKITDVPDVDETSEEWDATWDKNRVIRDVAYYIRAHKFRDYDRRYYKRLEDSPSRLYEEFPKPPLRSLHWEVRKYVGGGHLLVKGSVSHSRIEGGGITCPILVNTYVRVYVDARAAAL